MSTIYDRIRARRLELGLTVEDLAQQLGYKDKSSISKIENGKADIPQAKVELFANALHTTTAYLMGVDGPALPPGCEPLPRPEAPAAGGAHWPAACRFWPSRTLRARWPCPRSGTRISS